jgi:hypothetical protein
LVGTFTEGKRTHSVLPHHLPSKLEAFETFRLS